MAGRTVGLLMVGSLVLGCAGTSKYTGRPEAVGWEDDLRQRASFELGCAPEQLEVVSLGGGAMGSHGYGGESAGVSGCGKRAVYKFLGPAGGWVANTAQAAQ